MPRLLRLKKFIASKVGNTKLGRKAQLSVIGEHGKNIVNAIKQCVLVSTNPQSAKFVKKGLMKMATKGVILYRNSQINPQFIKDAGPTIAQTLNNLIDVLEVPQPDDFDMNPFISSLEEIHWLLKNVLTSKRLDGSGKPLVKEKNSELLTKVFDVIKSEDFLKKVIHEPELEVQRRIIASSLRILLRPYESEILATQFCAVNGCNVARAAIHGTKYCLFHHNEKYNQVQELTLGEFLEDESHRKFFEEYIMEHGNALLLSGWLAMQNFKTIRRKGIIESRAKTLYNKYFNPSNENRVVLSDEALEELKEGLENPSTRIFNRSQEEIQKQLEKVFTDGFKVSEQFQRYCNQFATAANSRGAVRGTPGVILRSDAVDHGEENEEAEKAE